VVLQVGLQAALGDFGILLGGQATKSIVRVRPKTFFVLILDRNGICLPSNLVLAQNILQKVNQGPVLFLETLQSPVDFFRRAKLFYDCLTSFVLYLDIFVDINGLFTLGETRDEQLFKECRKKFL
jgi:hypothetical protein